MVLGISRLFQYPALCANYYGIRGYDERGLALVLIVDLARVDFAAFLRRRLEDVLIGRKRFREVFFESGGDDVDLLESELWGVTFMVFGVGGRLRTMLRSCFLRGEAEARTTRLFRN